MSDKQALQSRFCRAASTRFFQWFPGAGCDCDTIRSSDLRHLPFIVRIVGLALHAPAPFGVEVAHAAFVVDRHVFLAAMEHPRSFAPRMHRAPLAMHTKQVFVQIAAERSPDGVVVV